ncbi:hypothetical protein EXU30_14920 [Shewanella maritima]|uniref:Lipoprotein n=1 Tax=Shewanella maritima TaxID=2520507 RepID=A0A411PK07_9GAMM|nr:hypothetical protein [Shewanella maritima]QBF83828.1 hypothetical protein EXU30_14920 [Shewanella maritima]
MPRLESLKTNGSLLITCLLLTACLLVTACSGPPTKSFVYTQVQGAYASGCMNEYQGIADASRCDDYQLGPLVVEMMPRGSKKYHSDPELPPYKIPALVCTIERGQHYDFKKHFKVESIKVTTNSGKQFSSLNWGFINYNQDCKYIAFTQDLPLVSSKILNLPLS